MSALPPGSADFVGETIADFRWFPAEADPAAGMLSFAQMNEAALSAAPFLDQRAQLDSLPRRRLELHTLAAQMPVQAAAPALNFIWHSSFCCSTLIAHALNAPGRSLALSEPLVLVRAADARRARLANPASPSSRLSDIVFRLLARPPAPDAKVTVKPSNFANVLIPEAARLTAGKMLFLYSDLPSFLVSIAKGGVPLHRYARRLFSQVAGDLGEALPWPAMEVFQMSDLEIAALAWHLQIAEFRRHFESLGTRAASLDCGVFLREPAAALKALDVFLGLGFGNAHWDGVAAGALLHRNAKVPSVGYDPSRRGEEHAAIRAQLGGDLERIVKWSYKACSGAPQGAPLPRPLLA